MTGFQGVWNVAQQSKAANTSSQEWCGLGTGGHLQQSLDVTGAALGGGFELPDRGGRSQSKMLTVGVWGQSSL